MDSLRRFRGPRPGRAPAWAFAGLLLLAAPPVAAQAGSRPEPAGQLSRGLLSAEVGPREARAAVALDLHGTAGLRTLPLQALAFGGAPEGVEARTENRELRVELAQVRPGFWEGRVVSPVPLPDSVRLRLSYRVPGALRRGEPDGGGPTAVLALPWLVVPWPPEDGSPGRVRIRLVFAGAVELGDRFPTGLAPEQVPAGPASASWHAALPVLPALTRAVITGGVSGILPADAVDPAARSTGPPATPDPGFVFHGLFLTFGLLTAGYAVWMWRRERRE